jgi:hypothetical protein
MLNHEFLGKERLMKEYGGRIVGKKEMNPFATLKTL